MVITKKHIINIALLSTVLFFAFLFTSAFVFADDTIVSNVHISVPASCNLESAVDEVHSASINNGTYRADIGVTFFTITCNDSGGYSVYAVGYTNNEYGNTKLLATIGGSLNPTYDIITGIGTNSTETGGVSNWAMKLTPIPGTYAPTIQSAPNTSGGADASFSSYHVVPSTYTKVATFPSNTDSSTGSSFTSTYAAFIAANQPAGTYAGKVKYTMVHPASEVPPQPHDATVGCISYWPNASGVADNMGDQCSLSNNASVDLWPTNFSRPGYGFAGWSDQFDYDLSSSTNTGHIYGPMETIITPSDITTKGLSLYAVWVKSTGDLQGWTGCSSLTSGAVTALTDQRDNNTYAVAKLADDKCWMIENLRLNNTNSDNATGALAQGYDSSFVGLANAESPWSGNSTTANSLYSTDGSNNTTAITGAIQAFRFPRYNNDNTNNTVANMTSTNANIYSYGNYYTWPAVVAYTRVTYGGTYGNNQSITTTSICPSGWHLPTGGQTTVNTTADFYVLGKSLMKDNNNESIEPNQNASDGNGYYDNTIANKDGKTATQTFRSFPNNFLYSGYVDSSSIYVGDSHGRYWSSTLSSAENYAYYLIVYGSRVNPSNTAINKSQGFTARCLVSS